jgi:hypothetical protein
MMLNLIPITTTVSLLHDVASCGQIVDSPVGTPLGDAEIGRDVPQTYFRVTGNTQKHPAVIAEKGPTGHGPTLPEIFQKTIASEWPSGVF